MDPEPGIGLDLELAHGLIDASVDVLAVCDLDGTYLHVSGAMERLFGWSPAELLGTVCAELFHPDDQELVRATHSRTRSTPGPQTLTARLRTSEGNHRWVEIAASLLPGDGAGRADLVRCSIHDISERRRLEASEAELRRALADSERRFVLAWEHAPIGVAIVGLQGEWIDVNPALCRILGYDRDDLQLITLFDISHPDDREQDEAALRSLLDGSVSEYHGDKRYIRGDGSVVWAHVSGSVVHDAAGAPQLIVSQIQDTSDSVRAAQLEREMTELRRGEMAGRLAGGLAHRYNNIAAVLMIEAELLQASPRLDPVDRAHLAAVLETVRELGRLSRELLVFTGRDTTEATVLDLRELVTAALPLLHGAVGEHIELVVDLDDRPCLVRADRSRLDIVVADLVLNAHDAIEPRSGRVVVSVGSRAADDRAVEVTPPRIDVPRPPHWVVLEVSDDGEGIDAETADHIFEPFFSTRPGHIGMGLPVMRRVARDGGGEVEVRSEPGHGTTVQVWLPGVPDPDPHPGPAHERTRPLHVLVVDDREDLLAVVTAVLEAAGHHVEVAASGAAALGRAAHGTLIDLLITDIVMPGMTGRDLAEALRAVRPDLPVVFMSGYTDLEQGVLQLPRSRFLAKPFSVEQLLDAVDAAVATP